MNYFSHIGQDRWVNEVLRGRRNGYFLDFGTFDGVNHSNTFYFEKYLGWKGICVEPNPLYYADACAVRNCITVNAALWPKSRQSLEFFDAHGLSSLVQFKDTDSNAELRGKFAKKIISVDTINPTELLDRFAAPSLIEYMSLDVEGCELDVLQSLDLKRYRIALATIEHNHNLEKQAGVRKHLADFGYEAMECYNDDYFFHPSVLKELGGPLQAPAEALRLVKDSYKIRDY